MNIILNNITNNSTKNIKIKEFFNVSDFIKKIYINLEKLEPNNYYCILFKYNNYKKIIKAKLGYIYNDINNSSQIILTCDENYLQYNIEKYSLSDLEIEYTKNIGVPKKINIIIEREQIAMGDDGPYLDEELFSPEIKLTKLIMALPYYNIYKFIEMLYTNIEGQEESFVVKKNGELIVDDTYLSELIQIKKIDTAKGIMLKLTKYDRE